ncbi:hypothetical protein V7S43_013709 [Phytophthora oleae]|uniref:Uncharacterized protein n=1 Tax=Phytophthora oleae TaxID=2107226 RepID=A0ABD3F4Z8_9STRA
MLSPEAEAGSPIHADQEESRRSGHPNQRAAVQEGGEGDRGDAEVQESEAVEQEGRAEVHPKRFALYQQSMQGNLLEPRRQRREKLVGTAPERAQGQARSEQAEVDSHTSKPTQK